MRGCLVGSSESGGQNKRCDPPLLLLVPFTDEEIIEGNRFGTFPVIFGQSVAVLGESYTTQQPAERKKHDKE